MNAATLTKPEETTREDGVSGYAAMMMDTKETSKREMVQIVAHICEHHEMTLSVDKTVKLYSAHATNRVVVFSDSDTEMIVYAVDMPKGGTVIIYPAGEKPDGTEAKVH